MKLISFERNDSKGFGAVVGTSVFDLTGKIGHARTLREFLAIDGFAEASRLIRAGKVDFDIGNCTLLPVIPDAGKIICLGLNFKSHAEEVGKPVPAQPVIFHRHAQTLNAHGRPLLRPLVSEQLDYEGELAVVIGKGGGHIPEDRAMEHVAGYACFNEASVRDWQKHSHLYGMGKNFRSSGAFGPWLVTRDEITDPNTLHVCTRVNGKQVQFFSLGDMVFNIAQLIAYVSRAIDWMPGDVLVTGTASGVGLFQSPPCFLRDGDVVEIDIPRVGTLVNPVLDETAAIDLEPFKNA
ncbi:2-keto-4-pentenoate hydratase/2-oxohepta-3-ene-1,7-dioic acid hydratase (catechol pathway) [Pseudomonas sp. NFIX10]|uniref:fumarylacetoacetate hydrolase family protein n=1 Tax=unclassified Pseudomonas TaxID=196821 RepID=UPI0008EC4CDA|nr:MULTISPECIES: fumarylacetoacetate hydrolase family protein [unclassified Pseudomonas]SFA92530.1 2-keto-4-pentenoate hydratase/2-oxohepta-3-ene-1,7-dioic acid hydratase (catechol pathway) [Pseudomonas sp. NFIX10]SFE37996.1 2-keto-4-pentenoate hydratase/2-oxohepta-3-ene-1,7-dioic acid hydratase (catechol pathway) [Pseudomonas sp. NFACC06-1]